MMTQAVINGEGRLNGKEQIAEEQQSGALL